MLEQVGGGGQGVVWSALDAGRQQVVAIKLSEIEATGQQQIDDRMLERQAASLVKLRHPCVLPLYEFGLAGQLRYSVSRYVPGGSLRERLSASVAPLPVLETLKYAAKIASALDYLHDQDVVHRDLKPSNILMDLSDGIYLADFGLARVISETTRAMHTGRGTPPYAPPEQHTMAQMTPQSDLFSFGVMLYELFVGQLPWNGEKTLGIEQLLSKVEIPDPSRINPQLSPLLAQVLRRMTAATPAARPRSAGEVMRMLYYVFKMEPPPEAAMENLQSTAVRVADAQELLKIHARQWDPSSPKVSLSLTKLALVDLEYERTIKDGSSSDLPGFMLRTALAYGYRDDFWWKGVANPHERLRIGMALLGAGHEVVSLRVLDHLIADSEIARLSGPLPENMAAVLLDMAAKASEGGLRLTILKLLRTLLPSATEWREVALHSIQDGMLARLAFEDSPSGDEAALLIGHVRSGLAVRSLLAEADDPRRVPALLIIQRAAGGLPASVPLGTRLAVTAEWIVGKLMARPAVTLTGYALTALGVALGVALQVYLTYRLPDYMDFLRISVSLERGVMLGTVLGLGLFMTRLLVERFPEARVVPRVLLATLLGGVLMNVAMFIYDVLILGTPPAGGLVTAACLLIALGNALSSLLPTRPTKSWCHSWRSSARWPARGGVT